jgi:hypothetical protein
VVGSLVVDVIIMMCELAVSLLPVRLITRGVQRDSSGSRLPNPVESSTQ